MCVAFPPTILILKEMMTIGPLTNNFRRTEQIVNETPSPLFSTNNIKLYDTQTRIN